MSHVSVLFDIFLCVKSTTQGKTQCFVDKFNEWDDMPPYWSVVPAACTFHRNGLYGWCGYRYSEHAYKAAKKHIEAISNNKSIDSPPFDAAFISLLTPKPYRTTKRIDLPPFRAASSQWWRRASMPAASATRFPEGSDWRRSPFRATALWARAAACGCPTRTPTYTRKHVDAIRMTSCHDNCFIMF